MDKEQILERRTVFSTQQMDSFDLAYAESQKITEDAVWVPLYMKVGLWCGWSYNEFMETDYTVIKNINNYIDKKLENAGEHPVHWMQLFAYLAISKALSRQ